MEPISEQHPWTAFGAAESDWNDWRWQLKHALKSREELERFVRLTDSENGEKLDLLADRAALDAYHDALTVFLKSVRANCASREAPYMLLDSEKPFEESFIPLLSQSRMI